MASVDDISNNVIDKLLTIYNKDYLPALNQLVNSSDVLNDKVNITKEQELMLELSDLDIQANRFVTQEDLDKNDLQWLNEKQYGPRLLPGKDDKY